jgi:membrane fusion protein, multidrug efflux system
MADDRKPPEGKSVATRRGPRKRVVVPLALLLLAAVVVVGYWLLFLRGFIATDDAYVDGDAITVSAKILGRVTSLGADEGDTVAPGQVLVRLDDRDLRAREAQSRAGLELAQRNVPVAQINLDRARDDFDRASYQFRDRVVTREQLDHARQALDLAQAQVQVAQGQVGAAQAALDVVTSDLANLEIAAPQRGIVARKWIVPGDIVQPGQPIFTLYDLDDLWITANFEETKLSRFRVGDAVRIVVDAQRGRELSGTVTRIGAAAASRFALIPPNNASGNFTKVTQRIPIRIDLASATGAGRGALLPGMSVEVKVLRRAE